MRRPFLLPCRVNQPAAQELTKNTLANDASLNYKTAYRQLLLITARRKKV